MFRIDGSMAVAVAGIAGASASITMLGVTPGAHAAEDFFATTDVLSYSGTVTKYGSLTDAQLAANPVAGPFAIPARATEAPLNTPARDASIFFLKNAPQYDDDPNDALLDANIFYTAWWYSTQENTNGQPKDDPDGDAYYSGRGNPSNTNPGFLQLYDDDGDTDTSASASFSNMINGAYRTFTLDVSGGGATFSDDYARLWAAPKGNSFPDDTYGTIHSYDLSLVVEGVEGVPVAPGVIESSGVHPSAATGTLTVIFENTGEGALFNGDPQGFTDSDLLGFYRADFTIGLDSWVLAQGDAALNGDLLPSVFATVPEPATLATLGMALSLFCRRRGTRRGGR